MKFKLIFLSITLCSVFSQAAFFSKAAKKIENCDSLSGTYECKVYKESSEFIEIDHEVLRVIDDANMPLVYRINVKNDETSSELQHVAYSSSCKKNQINIQSVVKNIAGPERDTTTKVTHTYSLSSRGELLKNSTTVSPQRFQSHGTMCERVVVE